MTGIIRPARAGESDTLKNIWKTVFGDTNEFIDLFFRYYGTDYAVVSYASGEIAAAGYLMPYGSLNTPDGASVPCAMIYSVAVLPAHRSRGLGAELTRTLIESARESGYPAVALRPASDGLFGYYAGRTELREWFYAIEYTAATAPGEGRLTRLTAAEYLRLRAGFLAGTEHIAPDECALSFQNSCCELAGGGLYAISIPGVDACAVVEAGEAVSVKELLTIGAAKDAAAAIAGVFPSASYTVRTPAYAGHVNAARRFGMLAAPKPDAPSGTAWFGLAFD